MLKILFLCTGNSCRSQMAEGWARHLKGDCIDAYSAGTETHGLNPLAVKAMDEGAHAFLEKPCAPSDLLTVVQAALTQRAEVLEARARNICILDFQVSEIG